MEDTDLQHRVHDFYAGRGPEARYLGTVVLREDVGKLADRLLAPHHLWREGNTGQKFTALTWTSRVRELLASVNDVAPESVSENWPHPYKNSLDSDYSWWFETGGLYLYNLGALVEIRYPGGGIKSKLRFPDFTPPKTYTEENAR